MTIANSSGKPSGLRGVESVVDQSGIAFGDAGKTWVTIAHATDNKVAYGFPAIPVDDAITYEIIVRHRSLLASASGFYLRMNELDGPLGVGKTHIGTSTTAEPMVEQRSNVGNGVKDLSPIVSNATFPPVATIPLPWTVDTYHYTPSPGVKFASFSMYNWAAITEGYEVDSVQITPLSTNALLLANGPAAAGADVTGANTALDTTNVAGDAATSVVRPGNPITAGNVTTYLKDLAVDTLQIANEAVTVPTSIIDETPLANSAYPWNIERIDLSTPVFMYGNPHHIIVTIETYAGVGTVTIKYTAKLVVMPSGGSIYSSLFSRDHALDQSDNFKASHLTFSMRYDILRIWSPAMSSWNSETNYVKPTVPNGFIYRIQLEAGTKVGDTVEPVWPTVIGQSVWSYETQYVNGHSLICVGADPMDIQLTIRRMNSPAGDSGIDLRTMLITEVKK